MRLVSAILELGTKYKRAPAIFTSGNGTLCGRGQPFLFGAET